MKKIMGWCVVLAATGLFGASFKAQVVRESGAASVAGVLNKVSDFTTEYVLEADGDQLLIADLDAELFRTPGGCGGEEGTATSEAEGDTCGCEDTETGPQGFYIEVYKDGVKVCSAGRPARPGWERDPRLACLLEDEATYTVRVRFVPKGENPPDKVPFLLNVTLRDIAPGGMNLKDALLVSKNEMEVKPMKE